MDDDQNSMPADDALDALLNQSEAEPAGDEPESDAETGTGEEAGGDDTDAGDDDAAGDEEDTEGEGEEEGDEEPSDEDKKRKRPSGYERMKRRAERAEAALRDNGGHGAPARPVEITREALIKEIGLPPKQEDYGGDYAAYDRALGAYEADARTAVREMRKANERAEQAQQQHFRDLVEDHHERIEEFRTKVPDFEKTLKAATDVRVSPTVERLVIESDQSAHLVYYLAKNPAVVNHLNSLTPIEAARAMGRVEAKLALPKPRTATKAPKPVVPIKGRAAPNSPDKELDQWISNTYRPPAAVR